MMMNIIVECEITLGQPNIDSGSDRFFSRTRNKTKHTRSQGNYVLNNAIEYYCFFIVASMGNGVMKRSPSGAGSNSLNYHCC